MAENLGILRLPMSRVVGFEDAGDLRLDIESETVRRQRAEMFRDWLAIAIPKRLRGQVCFVDYTVFQDTKIDNPYFYLVTPTEEVQHHYREAVKNLIQGAGDQQDCFSVAFHPEFVGVVQAPDYKSTYAILPISSVSEQQYSPAATECADPSQWVPGFYPLRKDDPNWPPTTRSELKRICGRHTLKECLERFRSLLFERRQYIHDSCDRPLTYAFCFPFLVSQRTTSTSSDQPFSEIAGALFLGVSFEGATEELASALEFMRTLALWTYRITGAKKSEQAGRISGEFQGLELAIETFAHQIKGVANAMSTKWSASFEQWERIKSDWQIINSDHSDLPNAEQYLAMARVLPAPQLIDAVRETLILWSQTRSIEDLYKPRPRCFRDVVVRAWDFTNKVQFVSGNINSNLGESYHDLMNIWKQSNMQSDVEPTGDVDLEWRSWDNIDTSSEIVVCFVTRLLVALFDNATEHGVSSDTPDVNITYNPASVKVQITVSNIVGHKKTDSGKKRSRLRIGMKGVDVIRDLVEKKLNGVIAFPEDSHMEGEMYSVQVEIPFNGVFPSARSK